MLSALLRVWLYVRVLLVPFVDDFWSPLAWIHRSIPVDRFRFDFCSGSFRGELSGGLSGISGSGSGQGPGKVVHAV